MAGIVTLLFFALLAALAITMGRVQWKAEQSQQDRQAQALAKQLEYQREIDPLYQQALENKRRYKLAKREMRLKERLADSMLAIPQYGALVSPEVGNAWVPIAPVHKPLQIAAPATPDTPQDEPAIPSPIDAYELLRSGAWQPRKGELLLAVANEGLVTVSIALAWHIALAGATGGGKTNMLRLLLAQLVAYYECYYISPAFAPIKATGEDWRQIENHLGGPVACEGRDIRMRLQWAVELYRERQRQERAGDFSWQNQPVYVVIDEYIAVCKLYPEVARLSEYGAAGAVSELLRFARQYQVFVVVASQDFLIKNIGGDSGARDCYRTAVYFGGDPVTARSLLDITGTLPYEQDLGKEGFLVLRTKSTQVSPARAPLMSNRAIYELLGWPADPLLDEPDAGTARGFFGTHRDQGSRPMHAQAQGPRARSQDTPWHVAMMPSTGSLTTVVDADVAPAPNGPEKAPALGSDEKQFTPGQDLQFIRLYREYGNVKECLRVMKLGNRYMKYASWLVEHRKLRKA